MTSIEFGTVFKSTDGQKRVVVDVGDDSPDANFETLGIVGFKPLLITYISGSADPSYIAEMLDIVLSVDDVVNGIAANSSSGINANYEVLLRKYASIGKIRTISL
ncbi:hypothetical protein KBD69_02965 [Candidatus Woesebacteria bacterium]|nr:hypothetical protein [Candidatus Woesebacteria bacterium]